MVATQFDAEPIAPMTLAEQVRQRLRSWILNGRLKPGDRLRVQELAGLLKVSDTTVREALSRLRQTGIVQSVSWVGARVKEFTRSDIEEVFDLRKALECFAVRLAATRISEDQLRRLREQLRVAEQGLDRGESGPWTAANNELHAAILAGAGNSRISSLLEQTYDQIYMFAGFGARSAEGARESLQMHLRFVDLLLQHDAEGAARLMEEYLEVAKQQALQGYFGATEPPTPALTRRT